MIRRKYTVFVKQALLIASITLILTGCTTISRFFALEQTQAPIKNIATKITYYTAQQGDSLYDLSRRFNVTERTLILWNHIQAPYLLSPGQTIRVSPLPGEKTWRADEEVQVSSPMPSKPPSLNQAQDFANNAHSPNRPVVDPSAAPETETATTPLPLETSHVSKITPQVSESRQHQAHDNLQDATVAGPRPAFYFIQSQDSLLEIANRFNINFSALKAWNNIDDPNLIYVGQKILLNPPAVLPSKTAVDLTAALQPPPKKLPSEQNIPKENNSAISEKTIQQHAAPGSQKLPIGNTINNVHWAWPLSQRGDFIAKALDKDHFITVAEGAQVLAAATGDVIYAGIGTDGFGKMVILNHSNGYISAYSNLQMLDVKEAEKLQQGQVLGKVGKFNGHSGLDFEIRQNGQVKELSAFYHLKLALH